MRQAKKWVYYCDFCKKHSLRSLKEHEAHCTLNPDRTCRLCDEVRDYRALVKKLPFATDRDCEFGENINIKSVDLMSLVDGCPVCALTVFRLFFKEKATEYCIIHCDFNFKREMESWWADEGRADDERERP